MYEKNFLKRLSQFGFKRLVLSIDTFIGIIVFFVVYILTKGIISQEYSKEILGIFIQVSASLFAIVLAGLAIVTSFTDKEFVYAWKKIGEFDNMITLFQYNLYIPLLILLLSLFLRFISYNSWVMIILIALFAYMIFALIDLTNFICRYGLQRGEFIRKRVEDPKNTE